MSVSEIFENLEKLKDYKKRTVSKMGDQRISFENRKQYQALLNQISDKITQMKETLNKIEEGSIIKNLVKQRPKHEKKEIVLF